MWLENTTLMVGSCMCVRSDKNGCTAVTGSPKRANILRIADMLELDVAVFNGATFINLLCECETVCIM